MQFKRRGITRNNEASPEESAFRWDIKPERSARAAKVSLISRRAIASCCQEEIERGREREIERKREIELEEHVGMHTTTV